VNDIKVEEEEHVGMNENHSESTSNGQEPNIPLNIEDDKNNDEINNGDGDSKKVIGDENPAEEKFYVDGHQKEQERVNLVGIINKNISKLCKETDYAKNETAQRKVRTIFNIITESVTAEEIYDKILLEGLQYFAEFHGEDEGKKNLTLNVASPMVKHKEKSPAVNKVDNAERKDSIVSKILKEVNTPKQNRKIDPVAATSPKIKKSQTFAGQMKDENKEQESSGNCSITRDKASRQVRKYVRTSVSSVNLDQMDQDKIKENIEDNDKKQRVCKEIQAGINEITQEAKENKEMIQSEKNKSVEVPIANENFDRLQSESNLKDSLNIKEQTAEVPMINTSSELEPAQEHNEIENESQKECTPSDQILKKSDTNIINDEKDFTRPMDTMDTETNGGLSLGVMEHKHQKQSVQRTFAEALRDSKDKKKNHHKNRIEDEDSIVSRLLKEKDCKKSTDHLQDKEAQINIKAVESLKESDEIRDRTISECSDNLPDLCPIVDTESDAKEIEDEERWQKIHQSEIESKEVKVSFEEDVARFDDDRRGSIFMTDFDDEVEEDSDNELFADAEDKLIVDDEVLLSEECIEPTTQTIVSDSLTNMLKAKFQECSKSDEIEIDHIVDNLVVNILQMVEHVTANKTVDDIECLKSDVLDGQGNNVENEKAFDILDDEHENIIESETELDGCDNVYDMFDLSMKRLNFIEHSFKTIYTSNTSLAIEEEDIPDVVEPVKENKIEDKLELIRKILTSKKGSEEKLKAIEDVVKETSPARGSKST